MLTAGMVSALTLVGAHGALAWKVWPGARVEVPEPHPDEALKIRVGALTDVAANRAADVDRLRDDLRAASAREAQHKAEQAEARDRARTLAEEQAALQGEVASLRKALVLAAAERVGEDDDDDSGGAGCPPLALKL